jgi:glycosyltransferase involved in cell wall biosynthesis
VNAWRARYPETSVHYLPIGCTERDAPRLAPFDHEKDVVADGKAHYECTRCSGDWKRKSIEALVLPMIEDKVSLSLYGPQSGMCGWFAVPGAGDSYRGTYAPEAYAHVYARHKIYLGISWNWNFGGYGVKLARALATGIPVLWHRTVGMAEDGLTVGKDLLATSTAEETRMRVRELLADDERRAELGAEGQRFALTHWRWVPNLLRLCEEVNRDR